MFFFFKDSVQVLIPLLALEEQVDSTLVQSQELLESKLCLCIDTQVTKFSLLPNIFFFRSKNLFLRHPVCLRNRFG